MSAQVDVLAVLDVEITAIENTKAMVDFSLSEERKAAYSEQLSNLRQARDAVAALIAERDSYKFMFHDAVSALAEIDSVLGIGQDGCNDPANTIGALQDYMAGVARGFDPRDVSEMIAERDALREVLSEMTELAAGPAGGVSQAQKVAILKKARAALTTGESA